MRILGMLTLPSSSILLNFSSRWTVIQERMTIPFCAINLEHSKRLNLPPLPTPTTRALTAAATVIVYMVSANLLYVSRRAHLRRRRKRDIWNVRCHRDEGVSWRLYGVFLLSWQLFVGLYPVVETIARLFGFVAFMYAYPNAHGVGYILEPLAVQPLSVHQLTKHQIRLDWHSFRVNIGTIGRDGYRHPPTVEWNLPHVDAPRWGIKHWPWRRKCLPMESKRKSCRKV